MHNVKRVPVNVLSAEALEQRRAEEARKLDTYKQIEKTYLEHVSKSHNLTKATEWGSFNRGIGKYNVYPVLQSRILFCVELPKNNFIAYV